MQESVKLLPAPRRALVWRPPVQVGVSKGSSGSLERIFFLVINLHIKGSHIKGSHIKGSGRLASKRNTELGRFVPGLFLCNKKTNPHRFIYLFPLVLSQSTVDIYSACVKRRVCCIFF